MKFPQAIASVLLGGLSLHANARTQTAPNPVKICMEAGVGALLVVTQGETIATQMFANIGVGVEWYRDDRHCKVPPEEFLVILLSTGAPDSKLPGALAYSRLDGGSHIEVFYNRVVETVEPRRVPILLGHVLAHEIGHTLEGLSRHSEAGVMKAHWDERDFMQMSDKPLPFAPEDAELIQRGVMQRRILYAQRALLPGERVTFR
jgi:hypothetical protein